MTVSFVLGFKHRPKVVPEPCQEMAIADRLDVWICRAVTGLVLRRAFGIVVCLEPPNVLLIEVGIWNGQSRLVENPPVQRFGCSLSEPA